MALVSDACTVPLTSKELLVPSLRGVDRQLVVAEREPLTSKELLVPSLWVDEREEHGLVRPL